MLSVVHMHLQLCVLSLTVSQDTLRQICCLHLQILTSPDLWVGVKAPVRKLLERQVPIVGFTCGITMKI